MDRSEVESRCRSIMEAEYSRNRFRSLQAYRDLFAGFEDVVDSLYESFVAGESMPQCWFRARSRKKGRYLLDSMTFTASSV